MADTQTTVYGLTKPEVGASEDTWGEKLNQNLDTLDNLLSGSTTLQGAKLDDTTQIVDNADATKIVALSAGSLTTATTRTFTFPDATGTFVLADNTATLTNKTLTSPAILTGFTFDGTTVTALSGADTTVVTGTAGTSGNVATWNADGDVVDGGAAPLAYSSGTVTNLVLSDNGNGVAGGGSIDATASGYCDWVLIGDVCYVHIYLSNHDVSGFTSTNSLYVVGLPFWSYDQNRGNWQRPIIPANAPTNFEDQGTILSIDDYGLGLDTYSSGYFLSKNSISPAPSTMQVSEVLNNTVVNITISGVYRVDTARLPTQYPA